MKKINGIKRKYKPHTVYSTKDNVYDISLTLKQKDGYFLDWGPNADPLEAVNMAYEILKLFLVNHSANDPFNFGTNVVRKLPNDRFSLDETTVIAKTLPFPSANYKP